MRFFVGPNHENLNEDRASATKMLDSRPNDSSLSLWK